MVESTQEAFIRNKRDPSDINEHMETLLYYSRKCNVVAEFGVRTGVSTSAFLYGLQPGRTFLGYDIQHYPEAQQLFDVAKQEGKNCEYIIQDVLDPNFELPFVDFLFIDTWHTYTQLRKELEKHADKVGKYLVFHDTVSFGDHDEELPGYVADEVHKGLYPAIIQFVESNTKWKVLENHENNNGLLILENTEAAVETSTYVPKDISNIENPTETDSLNSKIHSETLDDAFGDDA